MTPLQKDALAKVAIRLQNLTNDEFNNILAEHSDSIFSVPSIEIVDYKPKEEVEIINYKA